jgi:hypothetical protein
VRRWGRAFGEVAVTYLVVPSDSGSRLISKTLFSNPGSRAEAWLRWRLAPSLDLLMARKQLLTLKQLAEASPRVP